MKRSQPRRNWEDARAKVFREGDCRVCGSWPVEAAHIIGRKHDKPKAEGSKTLYVHPDSVVPLCKACHDRFDGRTQPRIDLLGFLTPAEEARAVLDARGLELARVRLAPSLYPGRRAAGTAA